MRDTFIRILTKEAKNNNNIQLITGDLGFGVLTPFWSELPNQFINAGIAEQNMTSVAAGMALDGKIVFTYSIGNFPTLRCLEQIRNDCAYHKANVKIVCVGGGFVYGSLGMSHHATEDIAIMRALPDVTVFCPGDATEAEECVKAAIETDGTCYIRLGRGGEGRVFDKVDFEIGKAFNIRKAKDANKKIAVFSTGAILREVCNACDALEKENICIAQYSFPTVKPIDTQTIRECAENFDYIFTVEEHNIIGGFGSAVSEVMAECNSKARLLRLGIDDCYCTKVGDQNYLRDQYGISERKIIEKILEVINE